MPDVVNEGIALAGLDGILTEVNEEAVRMFGCRSEKDLLGKKALEFVALRDRNKVEQGIQELRKEGIVKYIDCSLVRADGSEYPGEIRASVKKDASGNPVGFIEIIRDTNKHKRTEEQLRQYSDHLEEILLERTKALEEARQELLNRRKASPYDRLAAGVGHEMKNLLSVMKSSTSLLNSLVERPEPEVKRLLDTLGRELSLSERIITGLLDYTERRPPVMSDIGINDVVVETLSRITMPENIEVVIQLDEHLSPVQADSAQLYQVFNNIIHNAAQAMPEGGRLTIKSDTVDSGWLAVSFIDTGVGIAAENLPMLFDPLFTTRATGVGFGLSIAKSLIELNGGTIEIQSKAGQGSNFTIKIPVAEIPEAAVA